MRNREVIRQWNLLKTLDAQRYGATVQELSRELDVTVRTIWRDLAALQDVGFPLVDEKDGKQSRWKLANAPFRGLSELGISTLELCSLYIGRQMVSGLAGAPFGKAIAAVCAQIEKGLPQRMRAFLDRLPDLVEAKPGARKKHDGKAYEEHLRKLLDACAERRVCRMRYYSASSGATKDYVVHPYRLTHAHGGMYLLAWVPQYEEIRTFALERMQRLSVQEDRFTARAELPPDVFAHSLGVNRGTPEKVVVQFAPRVAAYVREHSWHRSQKLQDLPDGGVRMTLDVTVDPALRTWILGFGAHVKVESPTWLAEEILEQLDEAREAYVPRLDLALPDRVFSLDQPRLPGLRGSESRRSPRPS